MRQPEQARRYVFAIVHNLGLDQEVILRRAGKWEKKQPESGRTAENIDAAIQTQRVMSDLAIRIRGDDLSRLEWLNGVSDS